MECPHPHNFPELGTGCPDAEACQSGYPCDKVRGIAHAVKMSEEREMSEKQDPAEEQVRHVLEDWWVEQSRQEMEACIPKAVEYGSTDLAVIGRAQGRLMGRHDLNHEEATELGIFFYLQGKLARWEDALIHGRRVSDDTLHDAAVYIKMEQRNRAVGGWPFAISEEEK